MIKKNNSHHFFIVALIASLVIVYFIAKPFLGPLILGAVFAFIFQPLYKKLVRMLGGREGVSAGLTTLTAIVVIVLPVALLGTQIVKESNQLYQSLIGNGGSFIGSLESVQHDIRARLPIPANMEIDVAQYIKQGLSAVINNLGSVFSSLAKILINAFIFLTALYFFLKDGVKLKNYLVALSPLDDRDDDFVVSRLKSAVSATVKGNLAIGVVQGLLTGIGFMIFGVPNAVLWGGVAVIAAFLPGIGTALVIAPAIAFLFLVGNTFGGVGLLIWGGVAVGLVDNFLGPRLVGRGMQLHPLAVLIAVLGGMAFFGPLGFLLGPLTMSVCLALIDMYVSLRKREEVITR